MECLAPSQDGVHNETEDTPQENIPQENIPQEATPQEATLETTLESRKENRQLPEFPMDPDLQIESVATHPPTATPLNPNGMCSVIKSDVVGKECSCVHICCLCPTLNQTKEIISHLLKFSC